MPIENQTVNSGHQRLDDSFSEQGQSPDRGRFWGWLSTGLILLGLLLLGAGGLMAYQNWAILAEPPPPAGLVESVAPSGLEEKPWSILPESLPAETMTELSSPPSLEENPLPVLDHYSDSVTDGESSSSTGLGENPLTDVQEDEHLGAAVSDAVSARSASPSPGIFVSNVESDGAEAPQGSMPGAMRAAEQEVPSGSKSVPTRVPSARNPPTRIVAPAIDLDSEIVPVGWKQVVQSSQLTSVGEVAEFAAGWHQNSALPGGPGNIVLSGHHNVKGEVFRYLVDLNPGDTITLYIDDQAQTYAVESRFVLRDKGAPDEQRRENARWIGSFPDERLTLVTCWPYTNNTHRVIVVAKPTP